MSIMKLCCFVISTVMVIVTIVVSAVLPVQSTPPKNTPSSTTNTILLISKNARIINSSSTPPPPPPPPTMAPTNDKDEPGLSIITDTIIYPTSTEGAKNQDLQDEERIQEEEKTIQRVVVVLCSLGASLFLVAIAIAILYMKVRRQQKLVKNVKEIIKDDNVSHSVKVQDQEILGKGKGKSSRNDNDGENNNNNNNNNGNSNNDDDNSNDNNNNNNNISDDNNNIIPSSTDGENNQKMMNKDDVTYFRPIQLHTIQSLSTNIEPSAPPVDKLESGTIILNSETLVHETQNIEYPEFPPPSVAPPAYTPSAPPLHSIPHIPIPEYDGTIRDMILYVDGNTYLASSSGASISRSTFIRMAALPASIAIPPANNAGAWYTTTSSSNTPTSNTPTSNTPVSSTPVSSTPAITESTTASDDEHG